MLGLDLQLHALYPALGLALLPRALRFYDPETGTKLLNREEVEQERVALEQENAIIQQERDATLRRQAEELEARLRDLGVNLE